MVHRPGVAAFDAGAASRFATGHDVGDAACRLLPDGVMIEAEPDLATAAATTAALLQAGVRRPLFEATFQHDGVLVRVDVLEPQKEDGWRIAEVKSSTRVKAHHLSDLATQVWVAREAGVRVASACIRRIDTGFVLQREGELEGLFADEECLEEIEPLIAGRPVIVEQARLTLAGEEPERETGDHCSAPFACEFRAWCDRAAPPAPEWPVTVLPRGGGRRWLEQGVADLGEIDPAQLANAIDRRVWTATVSGEAWHDVEGARRAMAGWTWPRSWLDFETIGPAVPRWVGARPYQQTPFQFSLHVEQEDGRLDHLEFLSLDGRDPRRDCAEALIAMVPKQGAVIAYNAGFERGRIMELAAAFPDLASDLGSIALRIVDLLPVARAHWYHRDQRGSWSIKAVLPTIAPELDYAGLDVQDGGQAQEAWLEAVSGQATPGRIEALRKGLLAYCRRDTEAMVVLARRLSDPDYR